jgi:hypothetical protein
MSTLAIATIIEISCYNTVASLFSRNTEPLSLAAGGFPDITFDTSLSRECKRWPIPDRKKIGAV